jgi:hypothetical protein
VKTIGEKTVKQPIHAAFSEAKKTEAFVLDVISKRFNQEVEATGARAAFRDFWSEFHDGFSWNEYAKLNGCNPLKDIVPDGWFLARPPRTNGTDKVPYGVPLFVFVEIQKFSYLKPRKLSSYGDLWTEFGGGCEVGLYVADQNGNGGFVDLEAVDVGLTIAAVRNGGKLPSKTPPLPMMSLPWDPRDGVSEVRRFFEACDGGECGLTNTDDTVSKQ